MRIAVKLNIEMKEGLLPIFANELYKSNCEIKKMSLTNKKNEFDEFEIDIVYTDESKFRSFVKQIEKYSDKFRNIKAVNLLEEKIEKGILEVRGRLDLENTEDYEINIQGFSVLNRHYIMSSKNPSEYTGVKKNIALVSCLKKSVKIKDTDYFLQYSDMEISSAVLNKFSGFNGFPLNIRFEEDEDLHRTMKAMEENFKAFRFLHFDDENDLDKYEELHENISIPVLSAEYDEMSVFLLSAVLKTIRKNKLEMKNTNIGFIGINTPALRLTRILLKMGCYRILGYDHEEKNMMFFEKLHGLATTCENTFNNCDIILIIKDHFSESEIQRIRPGVSIISLVQSPIVQKVTESKACKDKIIGEWTDHSILYPGMLLGMVEKDIRSISDKCLIGLAETLAEEKGVVKIFPDPFTDIHEKIKRTVLTFAD